MAIWCSVAKFMIERRRFKSHGEEKKANKEAQKTS